MGEAAWAVKPIAVRRAGPEGWRTHLEEVREFMREHKRRPLFYNEGESALANWLKNMIMHYKMKSYAMASEELRAEFDKLREECF